MAEPMNVVIAVANPLVPAVDCIIVPSPIMLMPPDFSLNQTLDEGK